MSLNHPLSKREREVLKLSVDAADYKVVGGNCSPPITPEQVSVHMSHIRKKERQAKVFLKLLKKFKRPRHPEKRYKGVKLKL